MEQSAGSSTTSLPKDLETLIAQATANYAVKDYDAAAELYSRATELQAEVNGEMSTANADLLYSYGRCLYHVAVSKSDVLGSKVAGDGAENAKKTKRKREALEDAPIQTGKGETLRVRDESGASTTLPEEGTSTDKGTEGKPYFQFTGDENFDDSDDDQTAEECR